SKAAASCSYGCWKSSVISVRPTHAVVIASIGLQKSITSCANSCGTFSGGVSNSLCLTPMSPILCTSGAEHGADRLGRLLVRRLRDHGGRPLEASECVGQRLGPQRPL